MKYMYVVRPPVLPLQRGALDPRQSYRLTIITIWSSVFLIFICHHYTDYLTHYADKNKTKIGNVLFYDLFGVVHHAIINAGYLNIA